MNVKLTEINNKTLTLVHLIKRFFFVSQNVPHTRFKFSIELCYLMMTEAAQDTCQFHFVIRLDSFPPPG